jgi:uncharacterized protein YciI
MEKGKLVLAGPETGEGSFGIVIFEAESLEHAREIAQNDPSVKNKVMNVEVYPFRVSLLSEK